MITRTKSFWIVILTFLIGIAGTFVWSRYFPNVETFENVDFAKIPTVESCEINNNPHKYDGKIIRLKSTLYWFEHGYFLADSGCSDKTDKSLIAIKYFDPKHEEVWKSFDRFRDYGKIWEPVDIVMVGRFTYKDSLGSSDGIHDRTALHYEIYMTEYATYAAR